MVEIDRRICQTIDQRHAIHGQRRSYPPNNHLFRFGAVDDEAADQYVFAGAHIETRRKIECQRRGQRGPIEDCEGSRGDLIVPGSGGVKVVPKKIFVRIDGLALRTVDDIGEAVILWIRREPVTEPIGIEPVKCDRDPLSREGGNGGVEIGI